MQRKGNVPPQGPYTDTSQLPIQETPVNPQEAGRWRKSSPGISGGHVHPYLLQLLSWPRHYEHLGLGDSLWRGTILHIVGWLATLLASTHKVPVTPHSQLWQLKIPPTLLHVPYKKKPTFLHVPYKNTPNIAACPLQKYTQRYCMSPREGVQTRPSWQTAVYADREWGWVEEERVCVWAQSCLTLCDPVDCSPPGSSVHGISQARRLEWLPFPSPGDLPDPGIKPMSPALAGRFFTSEPPAKPRVERRDVATRQEIPWPFSTLRYILISTTSHRMTKLAFPFHELQTGSSSHRFCPQSSLIWLKTFLNESEPFSWDLNFAAVGVPPRNPPNPATTTLSLTLTGSQAWSWGIWDLMHLHGEVSSRVILNWGWVCLSGCTEQWVDKLLEVMAGVAGHPTGIQ